MAQVATPSSWGGSLQLYHKQRQQLPWATDHPDYHRPKYVTHAAVKLKDREMDPVTMRYRDAIKEQQASEVERMARERKQHPSLRRERGWDLITNSSKIPESSERQPMQKARAYSPRSGTHNIISHLPKDFPTTSNYDEQKIQAYHASQLQAPLKLTLPKHQSREFDILSNKRVDHDGEAKERELEERNRREVEAKYWQEHDWDPISGTYYDQHKETASQQSVNARLSALRDNRHDVSNRPDYFRKAEGVGYNILTKEVRNPDVYNIVCARQQRRLRRPAPSPQPPSEVLQQCNDPGLETFGKTSFHRFTESNHDYDLITLNDKDCIPPRVPKPSPKWTKLKPHVTATAPADNPGPVRNLATSTTNSPITVPAARTQRTHDEAQATNRSLNVPALDLTGISSVLPSGRKPVRTKGL